MSEEDIELIKEIPELKYKIEYIQGNILAPVTIYGLIRMLSFKINYFTNNKDLDKTLRIANKIAVKNTWTTFIEQFNKDNLKLDLLTKEELGILLKDINEQNDI
jgi:hypothetical protein